MRKTFYSVVIALLILTNLYTLKTLQEYKHAQEGVNTSIQKLKEDPLQNLQTSLEDFALTIKQQKNIFIKLIEDTKDGWETHTQNIKDIYQQLATLEKEIERLKELRQKLEDDLLKQKEGL